MPIAEGKRLLSFGHEQLSGQIFDLPLGFTVSDEAGYAHG